MSFEGMTNMDIFMSGFGSGFFFLIMLYLAFFALREYIEYKIFEEKDK